MIKSLLDIDTNLNWSRNKDKIIVIYNDNDIITLTEYNIIWLDAVACLPLLVLSMVQPLQSCLCKLDHDY